VILFIGTSFLGDNRIMLAMFYPESPFFRPWQIATHMFMHADLTHLFFNMFGIFIFGPVLENTWGHKRFLSFYLISGFGAVILHMLVKFIELNYMGADPSLINVPVLGASGAVFGILAGYGMYYPNSIVQLIFPPIAMKAKYFVLIFAALELFLGVGNWAGDNIAHFAHLGGALFGVLVILYWRKVQGYH